MRDTEGFETGGHFNPTIFGLFRNLVVQGGHSVFKKKIQEFSRSFPGDFMIFPGVFIKDCSDIM